MNLYSLLMYVFFSFVEDACLQIQRKYRQKHFQFYFHLGYLAEYAFKRKPCEVKCVLFSMSVPGNTNSKNVVYTFRILTHKTDSNNI